MGCDGHVAKAGKAGSARTLPGNIVVVKAARVRGPMRSRNSVLGEDGCAFGFIDVESRVG
jgi:hypothetical protein